MLTLTLTLTFDLSTPKPRLLPIPNLNTVGSFVFELCCEHQCEKCTYWPCDLELWPFNPNTISLPAFSKLIPCTLFERFGIIRFWVMLQTNRQTDKQTDTSILPTRTDWQHYYTNFATESVKSCCDSAVTGQRDWCHRAVYLSCCLDRLLVIFCYQH